MFILSAKSLFAVSFADTVLVNKGFQSQTDYNKVKMLNKEVANQLKRLNMNISPYLSLAKDLAQKNNYRDLYFDLYMNYGLYWKYDREFKLAAEYYFSALKIVDGDEFRQLKVYLALAENYRASNTYKDGVYLLNKAIALMDGKREYTELKAEAYNRMAAIMYEIYFYPVNPDSTDILRQSKQYADSSLRIVNKNNFELIISNYSILGSVFNQLAEYDLSKYYLNKSVSIMEKYPDSSFTVYSYSSVLLNLAGYYYGIKDYDNAEICALKSIGYCKLKNIKIKDRFIFAVLSDIYEKKGEYEKAYYYEKSESEFLKNDKFNLQEKAIIELATKYKSEQQEKEIRQTEVDKIYQKAGLIAVVIMTVLIVIGFRSRHKALSSAHTLLNVQNQELHSLNVTKDKFFSIIAHDLKNPIFSMRSLIDCIVMDLENIHIDELQYNFELLQKSSRNVGELLENLLTWSRSQRGIIQFEPMELNTKAINHNCIDLAFMQAQPKNIQLVDLSKQDFQIFCDVNMLITVIRNLLSNAIKFTEMNGKVFINVVEAENKEFVEYIIEDTGIGIPADKISTLFGIDKSYQQLGTNQELGTGLGLILCKEFVEKNGGTIKVRSELGVGSTFSFTVPKGLCVTSLDQAD